MRSLAASVGVVLLTLGLIGPLHAHHGSAPHFDRNDVVSLTGAVIEVQFVNPHTWVHVENVEVDGSVTEWRCETSGASQLRRLGWSVDTLVAGDNVRIVGQRARREANVCNIQSMHLADGTELSRGVYVQATVERRIASPSEIRSRPRTTDNGQPNISGNWIVRLRDRESIVLPGLTEAGRAASQRYDIRYDDPSIHCESGNIVWDWARQAHVNDIRQQDDRVLLRYGYLDLERTIHLNVAEHPVDLTPTLEGHSIGRWENDTLVVDTIGFLPRAFIPRESVVSSAQMHVVEHLRFDETTNTLVRDYVVTDPLNFAEPYRGRDVADLAVATYQPYDCVEMEGENSRRWKPTGQ